MYYILGECNALLASRNSLASHDCLSRLDSRIFSLREHITYMYMYMYMLGTDLKPAARFKAVQTYLKPSGRFRSRLDGLRAVQMASKASVRTNVVTKPSSKRAA